MSYEEKTTSQPHQRDIFGVFKDIKAYALFWEQGVGKTKPTIDKFCYLYEQGHVQALFVIAPDGVQRNWANDQLPTHMPDKHFAKAKVFVWNSGKAKQKRVIAQRNELLKHNTAEGSVVLCMSYNSLRTKLGKAFARRFMLRFKCFVVGDESQRFKTPGAKITETMVTAGKYAEWKTILSGTPVTQGAFDVFSQIQFLDENFWKSRGLHPFSVFKRHFGIWVTAQEFKDETGFDRGYDQLVGYKNQEELKSYLKLIGHRLTKDTAGLKLPPKVYTNRYYDLTPQQRQVYNNLYEDYVTHLPETGDWLEAPDTIVRLTRLQQICCGYVATEAGEPVQMIDKTNPLLDCYIDAVKDMEGKAITWAKFTKDIDQVMEALIALGRNPVRYDGQVSGDQREKNKIAFQEGDATDLVGKPQSGATGLTLHAAKVVHYYSNSYNYEHRAQSEDRAHRNGLKHSVLYVDYVADNTIAVDVIKNLVKKHKFAGELLGDAPKEWIHT